MRLCLRHRLFSALTHVINRGLLDFLLPIDLFLSAIATCEINAELLQDRRTTEGLSSDQQQLAFGYRDRTASEVLPIGRALRPALVRKMLLYLASCLTARRFPSGAPVYPFSSSTTPESSTRVEDFLRAHWER